PRAPRHLTSFPTRRSSDLSFGLGGYHRTSIEEALPVRMRSEKKKDTPSLALMLVVDRSGSMDGVKIELAKEAALAAVELLNDREDRKSTRLNSSHVKISYA